MNSLQIGYYRDAILSLKQKRTNGKSNIAKPVLLLAIFDLIEEGHILGNKILFDKELMVIYERIFKNYSEIVTPIVYPYYYMRNDGFYYIKGKAEKKTPSVKYIQENIEYAYFADDLWEMLQNKPVRDDFKRQIIDYFLND